ncbi:MAG: DinB family protein [Anaerolineales bacterium]|nr:MAG: DinB family protein [Anaerolineales bacterium]
MTGSSYKDNLGKLLADVRAEEQTLWDSLNDDEHNVAGEIDRWAPKDHLAHATFWTERLVKQLQAAAGGEPPGSIEDYQKTNDEVYETNKDRSWEDILAWAEEVSRQFHTAFDAVSEEMLQDIPGPEGTGSLPLWQNVAFTGAYHPMHHIADIYLERGDIQGAQAVQERVAEGLAGLDESDAWQGRTQYNLACFYALHDKSERALALLKTAMKYSPNLVEWSKQDSDLDTLRELLEFQAMVADG